MKILKAKDVKPMDVISLLGERHVVDFFDDEKKKFTLATMRPVFTIYSTC